MRIWRPKMYSVLTTWTPDSNSSVSEKQMLNWKTKMTLIFFTLAVQLELYGKCLRKLAVQSELNIKCLP